VRVTVDHALCEGNAICTALAPDLFDLDDDGIAVVLPAAADDQHRADAEQAARACPRVAISVDS
jgi:ferredoxin